MFGRHIEREFVEGAVAEVAYEAFMENDGEFVVSRNLNGVEISRVLVPEAVAYALAELFDNERVG